MDFNFEKEELQMFMKIKSMFGLLKSEKGQGLVEYALILALIAVVAIAMLTGIGQKIVQKLTDISNALQ